MDCRVCSYQAQHVRSMAQHVRMHGHTTRSYYDTFLKKEYEGSCKECGKSTIYDDMTKGYRPYCSILCANKNGDGGWNHDNAEVRRESFSKRMEGNKISIGRPKGSKNKNPYPITEAVIKRSREASRKWKGIDRRPIGWNHSEETKNKMSEIRTKCRKRSGGYFMQGRFKPLNPKKYEGDVNAIYYRSSWEMTCMCKFDKDTNIVGWSSEEVVIPYLNPVSGSIRRYFMDFKVKTADGRTILIEVKPESQTKPPKQAKRMTKRFLTEAATFGVNQAKWAAAREYAEKRGWEFQIWSEKEIGIRSK